MVIMIVGTAMMVTVATAGVFGGFRINLTPSEPLGLWRILALKRAVAVGDVVFVCPPAGPIFLEARKRGYLRSGLCPSGYAPLIKTVVANAGEWIEIRGSVRAGGREITHSGVMKTDGKGRSIIPHAGGIVPDGGVFLHSAYVGSWDSRYFGPVPVSCILGLAQEVLTYAP